MIRTPVPGAVAQINTDYEGQQLYNRANGATRSFTVNTNCRRWKCVMLASKTTQDYSMMRLILRRWVLLPALIIAASSAAQQGVQEIPVWPDDDMPFAKEHEVEEYSAESWGAICVFNVSQPTLRLYPSRNSRLDKAVIVLPGGGYKAEAMRHEGYDVARVLSQQGITAAVLKYRLPNPLTSTSPEHVPLADVRRAIRLVRDQNPNSEVGLLGFSAGSHLAAVASLWKAEDPREQPDFSVLVYGVTRLTSDNRQWLEEALYHRSLSAEEVKMNKLIELVTPSTPPAFLVHAYDDEVCDYHESTDYADALLQHGVPVEMHLFPKGGHGFGLGRDSDGTSQWPALAVQWIRRL